MERKVFETVIEVLAKKIDCLETELSLERSMSSFMKEKNEKLTDEIQRLNNLLTPPAKKGEENE